MMHKMSNRRLLPIIAGKDRRFWQASLLMIGNCWKSLRGVYPLCVCLHKGYQYLFLSNNSFRPVNTRLKIAESDRRKSAFIGD